MDAIISYSKEYLNSIIFNLKNKILEFKKIVVILELSDKKNANYYSMNKYRLTNKNRINQCKTEIYYLSILLDIISRLNVKISKSNYYITCLISHDINSLNENINHHNFINNFCELYIQSKIFLTLRKLKNKKYFNNIKTGDCLNYIKKELKGYTDITTKKLNLDSIKLNELNLNTLNFIVNLIFEIKKAFNFNTSSIDSDLSINITNLEETSKYSKNK